MPEDGDDPKALFLNAARRGDGRMLLSLMEEGVQVDTCDENGMQATHWAARYGHPKTLRFLLQSEADVNVRSATGMTPIQAASVAGRCETVELLLDHGARVNAKDETNEQPIHGASYNGHREMVALLLERRARVDAHNRDAVQPIYVAAEGGHTLVVRFLLDSRARVDCVDKEGEQPVHVAAFEGHTSTLNLLLESGASVHAMTRLGQHPLHIASVGGHRKVLRLLLEGNARPDQQDHGGKRPVDWAIAQGNEKCVKILTDAMTVDGVRGSSADLVVAASTSGSGPGHSEQADAESTPGARSATNSPLNGNGGLANAHAEAEMLRAAELRRARSRSQGPPPTTSSRATAESAGPDRKRLSNMSSVSSESGAKLRWAMTNGAGENDIRSQLGSDNAMLRAEASYLRAEATSLRAESVVLRAETASLRAENATLRLENATMRQQIVQQGCSTPHSLPRALEIHSQCSPMRSPHRSSTSSRATSPRVRIHAASRQWICQSPGGGLRSPGEAVESEDFADQLAYANKKLDNLKQDLDRAHAQQKALRRIHPALAEVVQQLVGDLRPDKVSACERTLPVMALRWTRGANSNDPFEAVSEDIWQTLAKISSGALSLEEWKDDRAGEPERPDVVVHDGNLYALSAGRRVAVAMLLQALNRHKVVRLPCSVRDISELRWREKLFKSMPKDSDPLNGLSIACH